MKPQKAYLFLLANILVLFVASVTAPYVWAWAICIGMAGFNTYVLKLFHEFVKERG